MPFIQQVAARLLRYEGGRAEGHGIAAVDVPVTWLGFAGEKACRVCWVVNLQNLEPIVPIVCAAQTRESGGDNQVRASFCDTSNARGNEGAWGEVQEMYGDNEAR